jgi:transcription antitermination factor NusG
MKLLMNGDGPSHVAGYIIDGLRSRERDDLVTLPAPAPPAPRFRAGDRVKVASGPLVGFSGLVAGMKPRERVAVLLELLGSMRSVELPAVDVKRIT